MEGAGGRVGWRSCIIPREIRERVLSEIILAGIPAEISGGKPRVQEEAPILTGSGHIPAAGKAAGPKPRGYLIRSRISFAATDVRPSFSRMDRAIPKPASRSSFTVTVAPASWSRRMWAWNTARA